MEKDWDAWTSVKKAIFRGPKTNCVEEIDIIRQFKI